MSDRSDPAVRAEQAFGRAQRLDRRARWCGALPLAAGAVLLPFVVDATVRTPGSLLGAIVGSVFLAGLALAVWPHRWSTSELEHHRLEAIWSECRTDAAERVPWERYAAWAVAAGEQVELVEVTCAPATDPEPRRLRQAVVRRLDADAIAEAAEAMERLREDCVGRELSAREAHYDGRLRAERKADDDALSAVDAAAARDQHASEAAMRRELAAEEAAGRRDQAAAVAEALRRP